VGANNHEPVNPIEIIVIFERIKSLNEEKKIVLKNIRKYILV